MTNNNEKERLGYYGKRVYADWKKNGLPDISVEEYRLLSEFGTLYNGFYTTPRDGGTADKKALSFLRLHDARRDEELVNGLAKWMLDLDEHDSENHLILGWESQPDNIKERYLKRARAAIKSAREHKEV